MTEVKFDKDRTRARFERLMEYAKHEGRINPSDFGCRCFESCSSMLAADLQPLRRENCGGLAHVGEEYDVLADGRELRILFVGKDYGKGNADLEERRRCIQEPGDDLNWHYKGVVKTLLEIFQREHGDGWQDLRRKMAQTNATKCCAPRNQKMACNTGNLRLNCWPHLRAEIEILEPTLIVFHGADLRWAFNECLRREAVVVTGLLSSDGCDQRCQRVRWTNFASPFSSIILFMNHPAAASYAGFDWERGCKIINLLRQSGDLPTFATEWEPLRKTDWPLL